MAEPSKTPSEDDHLLFYNNSTHIDGPMAEPSKTPSEDDQIVGDDDQGDARTNTSFKDLQLTPELLKAVEECGLQRPTEVQQRCIPEILSGKDMLCEAGHGMGSRTAIVLALLQQLHVQQEDDKITALVLCSTRASANQFAENFERLSKHLSSPPRTAVLCGGVSLKQDLKTLSKERPHIVVATVGRICSLVQWKKINLNDVMHFYIHESNQIIEQKDSQKPFDVIEKALSRQKQVVMFCSKLKEDSRPLYERYLKEKNFVEIHIEDKFFILEGLQQYYIKVKEEEKDQKLLEFLDLMTSNKVLIYVKDHNKCDQFCEWFEDYNIPTFPIHKQQKHTDMLATYRQYKKADQCIVLMTHSLKHQIDLKNGKFNIVINYNVPESPNQFYYMVSKAARLDPKGLVITFMSENEEESLLIIEQHYGLNMTELAHETFLTLQGFAFKDDHIMRLSNGHHLLDAKQRNRYLRRDEQDPLDNTLLLCLDSC